MKKFKLLLIFTIFLFLGAKMPVNASYLDESIKNFGVSADNMYLTSLSVLNSLNYEI